MATKQQPSEKQNERAGVPAPKKHRKKITAAMREQEKQARRAAWHQQVTAEPAAGEEPAAKGEEAAEAQATAAPASAEPAVPVLEEAQAPVSEQPAAEEAPAAAETAVEAAAPAAEPEQPPAPEAPAPVPEEPGEERERAEQPEPEAVPAWAPIEPEAFFEEPGAFEEKAPEEQQSAAPWPQDPEQAQEETAVCAAAEQEAPETPAAEPAGEDGEEKAEPAPAQEKTAPLAQAPRKAKKREAAQPPKEKKRRKRHYFATYVAMFTAFVVVVCAASIVVMFATSGSGLFSTTPDVALPNFNNLTRAEVEQDPSYRNFQLVFEEVYNDEKAVGVIFDQSPKAPKQLKENASITLRVSKGVHKVTVPDVIGWKKETVREKMKSLDLSVLIKTEINENKAVNTVLRTEPKAGATVTAGDTVTVYVAAGRHDEDRINVPNCVGMGRDKAVKLLGGIGLVAQTRTVDSALPQGTVVSQTPSRSTTARRGATVMLSISSGNGSGSQITGGQKAEMGQQLYPGGPTVGYGDGQVVPGSVSGHIHTWTAPDANGNQICTVCAATRHVN